MQKIQMSPVALSKDWAWKLCRAPSITGIWAVLTRREVEVDCLSQHPFTKETLLHVSVDAAGSPGLSSGERAQHHLLTRFLLAQPRGMEAVHRVNFVGQTPLHTCARYGLDHIARSLLSVPDLDLELRDMYDASPLIHAVREEHPRMVRILVNARADVNAFVANCHSHGDTPLILAARLRNAEIFGLLLQAPGLDMHQKSMDECPFGMDASGFLPSGPSRLRDLWEAALERRGSAAA